MHDGLNRYIAKLETSMTEGDALLAARDPASVDLVRQRCADAVALVIAYQQFVHREIFEPLMAHGNAGQRRLARELKIECIALTDELRRNIKQFMAQDFPFDWDYLSGRVQGFNAIVRAHVAKVRVLGETMAEHARAA